ncbi:MAG: hypothetical protein ACLQDY_19495 [Streptosporangiaceae bacterium]
MEHDLVTTPFGAQTTAAEVLRGVDLAGVRAVVASGASGIGLRDGASARGFGR